MMAMRFRSMGLVAAVAVAALACYMVSLRVAAERFALVRMEGRVLAARQDLRRLETEMGTRGRLVQLERWNSDVLALSAPKAEQYVSGAFQLASYAKPQPTGLPAVIQASATAPMAVAPKVQTVAYAPAAAPPLPAAAPPQPLLRDATYVRPLAGRLAPQKVALLDDALLSDISKAAESEAASSHARR